MPSGRPGQLCVTVTGLKPAYDDMEPCGSCCGISLPGYDGDEDHPLVKPFVVARLRREMQSTSTVRQAEHGWQPSTLGFNVQEEDVWLRLELHDAALAPEPVSSRKDAAGDKVQRSGLSGGLRKALGSLSSATLKRTFGDGSKSSDADKEIKLARTNSGLSAAQCMPAGEADKKKGGSFSIRRAFSSFTGGSRKGKAEGKTPLSPNKTTATKVMSPYKAKASPGTRAAAAMQAVTLEAGASTANRTDGPAEKPDTLIGRVDVKVGTMVRDWVMQHELVLSDRRKRRMATVQVSTMFVPLAREGWLQKLVASPGHPFGQWRVLWVELLEDGKLSWFDSSRKRKADFRGMLALDNAVEVGVSPRYEGQPSAAAYMELAVRQRSSAGRGTDTHIFKANHPDDAANWLADFQDLWRQQQGAGPAADTIELESHPICVPSNALSPPAAAVETRQRSRQHKRERVEDDLMAQLTTRSSAMLSARGSATGAHPGAQRQAAHHGVPLLALPKQQQPASRGTTPRATPRAAAGTPRRTAGTPRTHPVAVAVAADKENVGLRAAVGTPAKKRAGTGTPGRPPLFAAASGGNIPQGGPARGLGEVAAAAVAQPNKPSAAAKVNAQLLAQRPPSVACLLRQHSFRSDC